MPASEAQIRANQANAKKSTGPKTEEGKAVSRMNSYKHGLTATKVLPELEAAEVSRRYLSYCAELNPSGDISYALILRAATLSTRMERCVDHETATLTDRVRQAEADFEVPERVDEAEAARLRKEAGKRALFDPSPEAERARKYEAAAERGFFRALKEFRRHEKALQADEYETFEGELASNSADAMTDDDFDALCVKNGEPVPPKIDFRPIRDDFAALRERVDVPFSIGKRR